MIRSKWITIWSAVFGILCFNPCSLGWFARRFYPANGWETHHEFQSLFSWMIRSKTLAGRFFSSEYRGFNPCSLGWFARSRFIGNLILVLYLFQSLFSWMIRSKYVPAYFLLLMMGFNPCSLGWFARRILRHLLLPMAGDRVSILVLLDDSLEVGNRTTGKPCNGFQSLFSWMIRSKWRVRLIVWHFL